MILIWIETMRKIKSVEEALELFATSAEERAEATETRDYKTVNKLYDKIKFIIRFLKEHDRIGDLSMFYNHPSMGVRMTAAI